MIEKGKTIKTQTEIIHIDFKNRRKVGSVVYNNETKTLVSVSGDEDLIEKTVDLELQKIASGSLEDI